MDREKYDLEAKRDGVHIIDYNLYHKAYNNLYITSMILYLILFFLGYLSGSLSILYKVVGW